MTKSSKQIVGKGAAYIYLETIAMMISGYGFWIIMSKISTTDIIGISSAVVSLSAIFTVVGGIGVSNGIQRFLGKAFSEEKIDDAKVFVKNSVFLVCLGIIGCTAAILMAKIWIYDAFKVDFDLLILTIIITGSSIITTLFRSIVISSLKTKVLPKILIISSMVKIILAIVLVLAGTGAVGMMIGYTSTNILSSILFAVVILGVIFKTSSSSSSSLPSMIATRLKSLRDTFNFRAIKDILTSSMASWIPLLVTTIGAQLGTVVVFGAQGSNQAGVYFIALTIVNGITGVMYSLFTIGLPALSGMQDGRKRFTWHTIRLSVLLSLPFSSSLIFYSKEIMQLIGQDYSQGALSLQILLLSMLPTAILTGVNALAYSYGNYRQVLMIGLATSIPRTMLYFVLVPTFSSTGAAISYTIGAVVGFILSVIIAKKSIGMLIFWKDLVLTLVIPIIIAFILGNIFHINYLIGIIGTVAISYLLLLKLRVLRRSDITDSLNILPSNVSSPIVHVLGRLGKKSNRHEGSRSESI
jgi:O-antigen/teichoic acid export membrane protein